MSKIFPRNETISLCAHCKKYLSVGPVVIAEAQPICGRCSPSFKNAPLADFYENLARFTAFPCINDKYGCGVKCSWGSVAQHEDKCQFSPIVCPSLDCEDLISKLDFVEHYKLKHKSFVFKHDGALYLQLHDISEFNVNTVFLWMDQPFIFKIRFFYPVLFYDLCNIDESFKDTVYTIALHNYEKVLLAEEQEFKVSEYTKKEMFLIKKINITDIANITILCRITIKTNEPIADPWSDKILAESECPVCLIPMRPPIHSCKLGHSICHDCLPAIDRCPLCQHEINSNFRNYPLEKILNLVTYTCKNLNGGCIYRGKLPDIVTHEKTCTTAKYKCYLQSKIECLWEGLENNLVSHIMSGHSEYYIKSGDVICLKTNENNSFGDYFTSYENKIFRIFVRFVKHDGVYLLTKLLSYVDKKQIKEKFYCYFTFLDKKGKIITVNQICPVALPNDVNMDNQLHLKSTITAPFRQNMLNIEINILKV